MITATRIAVAAALPVDNPAGVVTDPLRAAAMNLRTLLLAHPGVGADEVFPLILGILTELDEQDMRTVTEALLSEDR
jgi:hypothetical protein